MEGELKNEFHYLVAKFLTDQFPEIGEEFVHECEKRNLFPSSVFAKNPSFEELNAHSLNGIPNDQLMKLVTMAIPKSKYTSLFFTAPTTQAILSPAEILINNLGDPLPYLFNFGPTKRIVGHFNKIFNLVTDFTSQILITGADDNLVKIWKIPDLTLMTTYHIHKGYITDIAVHPTNKFMAVSSLDHTISICSLQEPKVLHRLYFPNQVCCVKFSSDGKYMAAAGEEGKFRVWKVNVNSLLDIQYPFLTLEGESKRSGMWLNFSPAGNFLSLCNEGKIPIVLDLNSGTYLQLHGHSDTVDSVEFSAQDPTLILTNSMNRDDRTSKLWKLKDDGFSEILEISPRTNTNQKTKIIIDHWNCDFSRIVAITTTSLYSIETSTHTEHSVSITDGSVRLFTLDCHPKIPDLVLIGADDGSVMVWDVFKMKIVEKMQVSEIAGVTQVIWSPDGRHAFAADAMGGITVIGRKTDTLTTTQQMFPGDADRDPSEDVIYDKDLINATGTVLDPQPKHYRLQDLKLEIPVKPIHPVILKAEEEMRRCFARASAKALTRQDDGISKFADQPVTHFDPAQEMITNLDQIHADDEEEFSLSSEDGDGGNGDHQSDASEPSDDDGPIAAIGEDLSESESDERIPLPKTRSSGPVEDDEPTLPKTRSMGAVSDDEPPKRLKTTIYQSDNDSDFLDAADSRIPQTYDDDDDEGDFSDLEILSRSKSKQKKKAPSRSRPRQSGFVEEDDFVPEDDESFSDPDSDAKVGDRDDDEFVEESNDEFVKSNEVEGTMPRWMLFEARSQYTYVPQLGEVAHYCQAGHRQVAKECNVSKYIPPYTLIRDLPPCAQCVVRTIALTPTFLIVYLHFDQTQAQVAFPIGDTFPFLVPDDIYSASMHRAANLKPGDPVRIPFNEDGVINMYDAVVVSLRHNWQLNPYEAVTVRTPTDGLEYTMCPWELEMQFVRPTPVSDMCLGLVADVMALAADQRQVAFRHCRTERLLQKIWESQSFPMDFELFVARLKSRWYQTIDELLVEVNLFSTNASILGQDQETADFIVTTIHKMIVNAANLFGLEYSESLIRHE